jgi:hypothetical protein
MDENGVAWRLRSCVPAVCGWGHHGIVPFVDVKTLQDLIVCGWESQVIGIKRSGEWDSFFPQEICFKILLSCVSYWKSSHFKRNFYNQDDSQLIDTANQGADDP